MRFYEKKYPDVSPSIFGLERRELMMDAQVDDLVMVQVQSIEDMGAYVKLVSRPTFHIHRAR